MIKDAEKMAVLEKLAAGEIPGGGMLYSDPLTGALQAGNATGSCPTCGRPFGAGGSGGGGTWQDGGGKVDGMINGFDKKYRRMPFREPDAQDRNWEDYLLGRKSGIQRL